MFLDRENTRDEILQKLDNGKSVFLYSKHGIGKSALCVELAKNLTRIVRINHRNRYDLFDEGDVIIKLQKELDKKSDEINILPYNKFSQKSHWRSFFLSVLSSIDSFEFSLNANPIISITFPIIVIIKCLIKIFISEKVRESWKFYDNSKSNIVNYKKYINYVINNCPNIIINVTNIQVIDKTSFDFIIEMIKKNHTCFLLEYTEENMDGLVYYNSNFADVLHSVYPIQLPWLPDFEARKLIEQYFPIDKRQNVFYEFKKNGNLFPIVLGNKTEESLILNSHETTILYIIDLYKGNISYKLLLKQLMLITGLEKNITKAVIRKLQKRELIFINKNSINTADFQYAVNQTIKISVFKAFREAFERNYQNKELMQTLIPMYIEYDINGLIPFFSKIRSWLLQIADKEFTLSLLNSLCNKIDQSSCADERLILYVVDAYYSLALFSEAYEFLKRHKTPNTKYVIYEAMLLNRLDCHSESNALISSMQNNVTIQEKIILLNIEMINYASLRDAKSVKSTYNQIMYIKKAKKHFEYNYTLRNSHLAVDRSKAIRNIKYALNVFRTKNDIPNLSRGRISLAILYILDSKLKKAKKVLKKVNSLSKHQAYELSVSYNNLATISMREGEFIKAEMYLKDALQLSFDLFDRLSMLGNLLTVKTQTGDFLEGEKIAKEIMNEIEFEPDKKLKSCLYDELSKFYKALSNKELTETYYALSQKLLQEISTDKLTTNIAVTTPNGFIINQLAFWHFDLHQII